MRYPTITQILSSERKFEIIGDDQSGWDIADESGEKVAEGFESREAAEKFLTQLQNYRMVPLYMGPMNEILLEDEEDKKSEAGAWKWCGKCVRMTERDPDGTCKDCGN